MLAPSRSKQVFYQRIDTPAEGSFAPHGDPTLTEMVKAKFEGYFGWTAFGMLLKSVFFWLSRS